MSFKSFSWSWVVCLFLLSLALGAAACGGNDDPVLHLAGQDVKESTVRKYVRQEFDENQSAYRIVCRTVRAVSDAVTALVATLQGFDDTNQPKPLGTRIQGQKGDDQSMRRLGEILLEECQRAFA